MLLKLFSKISFHTSLLKEYFLAFQLWSVEKRTLARRKLTLQFIQEQAGLITFQRDGIWWTAFPGDLVGRDLFLNGQYELKSVDSLLRWLKENHPSWLNCKAMINVGANIGDTCIPLVHKTGKCCIACEPVPNTFQLLEKNIKSNDLTEFIFSYQVGISSKAGCTEMAVTGDSGWSEVRTVNGVQGFSKLSPVLDYIEVQMTTFEDLLNTTRLKVEDIGLVWSDTQGFESEVIKSGERLWSAGIPLWVEVWPLGLEAHGGVEKFISLCCQHFKHLISKDELERSKPVYVKDVIYLEKLISEIKSEGDYKSIDILLVP